MASVISNFFRKLSSSRMGKSRLEEDKESSARLNNWETTLMNIQKILIWDDPLLSCCCVVAVNTVFWLIIYLDFKFYGLIFTAVLILLLQQLWVEHISPNFNKNESNSKSGNVTPHSSTASNSRILTAAEINSCLKKGQEMIRNTYVKAKRLRQSQPGVFCVSTCLCFVMLSIIGRSISGVMSLYILLMLVMTVPGVFNHFLSPYVISSLSNFINSSHKEDENDEVESYLPETNQEALELLRLAGDLQLPKEDDEESNDLLLERISAPRSDTTESVCSKLSFYPESSLMPSPENSMDFLEFELPSNGHGASENKNNDINFQSKHFDGDSSDEEEFTKGLNLTEKAGKKTKTEDEPTSVAPSDSNLENLISIGKELLTAAVNQANVEFEDSLSSERESSTDTDSFEMISEEDM